MEKLKELMKKKWVIALVLLVAASMIYGLGNSTAKTDLEGSKVSYAELSDKLKDLEDQIAEKESEFSEMEEELSKANSEYEEKKSEIEEALDLLDRKDELVDEIATLDDGIAEREDKVADLEANIEDLENELSTLEGDIVEASGNPIELPPGQWIVGIDIPEGRYHATGESNLFVEDGASGMLMVNTILGEYVFDVVWGDYVENRGYMTLTPID